MFIWIICIIIILIISAYVLTCILNQFLFHPNTSNIPEKSIYNEFTTNNGVNGIFYNKGGNTPIIIYSHGNAGNIFGRQHFNEKIDGASCHFINKMTDYRGFGRSNGNPTLKGISEDGESVYNYVKDKYPNREIILWGESIGSGVSWYLAAKYEVEGLIITSGYSSLATVINGVVPVIGTLSSMFTFIPNNSGLVEQVKCQILLIHGELDTLIPISHAIELKNKDLSKDITLITVDDGHNLNINTISTYMNEFIDKLETLKSV